MPVHEFRFTGLSLAGDPIRGTVFAPSRRAAQRRISALSERHEFQPEEIEQRRMFLYKVRHPSGEVVRGQQKAYTAEEVKTALDRMGLEVLKVERKWIDFQLRPPTQDLIMFVRLSANMLRRKLPFDEILTLLAADTSNAALKQMIRDLSSDLRSGMDARQAFMKHQHVLGKFTAYMLGLAAESGNMAEMFEATAKYLERKDEFRKNVRKALVMPSITLLITVAAFVWYVWSIVPAMMGLFTSFEINIPFLTRTSLAFAGWMDNNYWWVILLSLALVIGWVVFARTTKGQFLIHKYMLKLPILGSLFHKLNLEVFCRVFGVLYAGSGENEEVMKIAAESTGNTYIEHQVKTITVPQMMAKGTDLIQSMQMSGVFLPMLIARFRSGAETGSVKESAEEMADLYEGETRMKLEMVVESIKLGVAFFISFIVGLLTVLSMETAFMMPSGSEVMMMGR